MNDRLETFNAHRRRLMAIAYRMLGTRVDAEDVLQDAWLRWQAADAADLTQLRSPEAWLVTITTRLCIDRLRALRSEREHYTGPWLPEPTLGGNVFEPASPDPTPEHMIELASDVSMAFLAVLERLSPDERAAFLLREVFDFEYDERDKLTKIASRNQMSIAELQFYPLPPLASSAAFLIARYAGIMNGSSTASFIAHTCAAGVRRSTRNGSEFRCTSSSAMPYPPRQ